MTIAKHTVDKTKVNTYGVRRRYKGRMASPGGAPRSSGVGGSQSSIIWDCGSTAARPVDTKHLAGRFKVSMKHNCTRFMGGWR